jgi:hypothetical protein
MGWRHQDVIAKLEAKRKARSAIYHNVRLSLHAPGRRINLFLSVQIKKAKLSLKSKAKKTLAAKKPGMMGAPLNWCLVFLSHNLYVIS